MMSVANLHLTVIHCYGNNTVIEEIENMHMCMYMSSILLDIVWLDKNPRDTCSCSLRGLKLMCIADTCRTSNKISSFPPSSNIECLIRLKINVKDLSWILFKVHMNRKLFLCSYNI